MYILETIKTKTVGRITVTLELVDFCEGSPWFHDLYTASEHIAGTTVQVPRHLHNGGAKHYIGQYTPSELAKDYAAQGKDNPSALAYDSLQKELAHYIQASNCALRVIVEYKGKEIASAYSSCFDYSYDYCGDVLDYYDRHLKADYQASTIKEAIKEAREFLN